MRALFTRAVALPLLVVTAAQAVLTMGAYSLSVVIPVAAADLAIEPEAVGYLVAVAYLTAMVVGLASGRMLAAFGVTRVFQLLLALVGTGAVVLTAGVELAAIAAAVLIGSASGPMNPAGSQVLVRVAAPDIRALVFSLKQCGTPAGGMLAGVLLPPLMIAYDWRVAMLVIPALALVLCALVPFGTLDPGSGRTGTVGAGGSVTRALRVVAVDPALRAITFSGFGLAVCQMALASYLVVFLVHRVGYPAETAGLVFAALHVAGIASRVAPGLIADRLLATQRLLVLIGLVMAVALAAISAVDSGWPLLAVYAVMLAAGASGNGWVGLYFAELARLSHPERVAEVAAGSQFVTYLGIVCGPTLFALLLSVTDSYATCFRLLAALAVLCAGYLAVAGR